MVQEMESVNKWWSEWAITLRSGWSDDITLVIFECILEFDHDLIHS